MEAVFLKLVNLSISAGWLVLAILVLRLVFRKAPRWTFCLLWDLVALRLVCPFSVKSALSLIPSAQTLPREILYTAAPRIDSGVAAIDGAVNPILGKVMAPAAAASANPTQVWSFILAWAWAVGVAVMALYALVSFLLLKRRVATATLLRENIRQSERVDSPFVLGLVRPVIYLPYRMAEEELPYVIAHEKAHIRRGDHWWKVLGFALLSVYWFQPLLWVAYVLLCRDIEGACDEKVIRDMDLEGRRGYAAALLSCGERRRSLAACPLAFGEVKVKARIKAVMHYKKPAFWIAAAALAACALAAVCFLTDPETANLSDGYDFDHDGRVETVEVVSHDEGYTWYELLVKGEDGTVLWREDAWEVHQGYNSLFACRLDGKDYLLRYNPMMYQGYATYAYELFSLNAQGDPVTCRENSVSFDINWGSPAHEAFDAEKMADFMDEVNGLLSNSTLLINTSEALKDMDPDHPQDTLWWLQNGNWCSDYIYDAGKTQRENLLEFSRYLGS